MTAYCLMNRAVIYIFCSRSRENGLSQRETARHIWDLSLAEVVLMWAGVIDRKMTPDCNCKYRYCGYCTTKIQLEHYDFNPTKVHSSHSHMWGAGCLSRVREGNVRRHIISSLFRGCLLLWILTNHVINRMNYIRTDYKQYMSDEPPVNWFTGPKIGFSAFLSDQVDHEI